MIIRFSILGNKTFCREKLSKEYFILDLDWMVLSHPKTLIMGSKVNPVIMSKLKAGLDNKQHGFVEYTWEGKEKVVYAVKTKTFDWIIATGDNPSISRAQRIQELIRLAVIIAFIAIITFVLTLRLARNIKEPDNTQYLIIQKITTLFRNNK